LQCKLIAVEIVSLEGNKNTAFRTVATIRGDAGMLLIELIKFFNIHGVMLFRCKITKKQQKSKIIPPFLFVSIK
jgi:hypothetical protein